MQKITQENSRFLNKLKNIRSNYKVIEWEKNRIEQENRLNKLCAYPHIFKSNRSLSNIKSRNNLARNQIADRSKNIKIHETITNITASNNQLSFNTKKKSKVLKALDIHTVSTQNLKSYFESRDACSSVQHKRLPNLWPLDISRENKIENNRDVIYSIIQLKTNN